MRLSPSHDQQARYAIAMIANLGQSAHGPAAATDALAAVQGGLDAMKDKIGAWTVVWGPALYFSDSSSYPDNLMYVARETGTNNYAVGIAGTNFYDLFDFMDEDLGVLGTVPWVLLGTPPNAAISDGTFLGLSKLFNTPASAGTPQAGVKIMDFLTAEAKNGALNLAFAGHSLGGALAPTLALLLQNLQFMWDPGNRSTIVTMPIAGPTPGNDIFADYLNRTLNPDGFYNTLDAVPHVWATGDLAKLATLYGLSDVIGGFIAGVIALVATSATRSFNYTATQRTPLSGTLQDDLLYLDQVKYQHLFAYDLLFFDNDPQPALHPPAPPQKAVQLSSKLADAVTQAGGTIPPYVTVVPPTPTRTFTVGKKTFTVPATADADKLREAVMAIAPYFSAALGL